MNSSGARCVAARRVTSKLSGTARRPALEFRSTTQHSSRIGHRAPTQRNFGEAKNERDSYGAVRLGEKARRTLKVFLGRALLRSLIPRRASLVLGTPHARATHGARNNGARETCQNAQKIAGRDSTEVSKFGFASVSTGNGGATSWRKNHGGATAHDNCAHGTRSLCGVRRNTFS